MYRGLAAGVLLAAVLLIILSGCSLFPDRERASREKLRMLYPAVSDYKGCVDAGAFSLDSAMCGCPVIIVATPISKVRHVIGSKDQEYMTMDLLAHEVLKGELGVKTITISVAVQNSAFMEVLARGSLYVFGLSPGDIGENDWATRTDMVFYLTDDDEIIPFKDDKAHRETLGMPLQTFRELVS